MFYNIKIISRSFSGKLILLFLLSGQVQPQVWSQPLKTDIANPHYFNYRGKPYFLITSDQHYGAVTNLDFDYNVFLDTLVKYGLNFTRIYPGAYFEKDGEYMPDNNLGARNGRQILPWAKTSVPGAHEVLGGYKLDLDRWNDEYFRRLKDFIDKAQDRNIIVDIAFFNGMYPDRWGYQAMYQTNNIQGIGNCKFNEVQTLTDNALTRYHEAYVRKITEEVNQFDNVILDICDEPFQDGCPPEMYHAWISKMIETVMFTESRLPKKHLVAQTIDSHTRGGPGDFSEDKRINVLMNEYTWGIANLDYEYFHEKPMILIETAYYPQYEGDKLAASRVEAWEFLTGGGSGFMQLNGLYSTFNPGAAGTENHRILTQLKVLKNFIESLDFINMRRDTLLVQGGISENSFYRAISEPGRQYAAYFHHSVYGCWFWEPMKMGSCYKVVPGKYRENMELSFEKGNYIVKWINPSTGNVIASESLTHNGGKRILRTPEYSVDIALLMISKK
ncbi:MAG TPA: hypothetical protein VMV47_14830 [Bacteroidales bacterium]|nr:hypothetical protein [Bacteroidales bacterium]